MRRSTVLVLVTLVALGAFAVGLAVAAAPKSYQFTGNVVELDPKAGKLTVDKGGDVWEFTTTGLKDLKAKKGDKITVHYQMIAKKVEPAPK
jgi:hypothetical protein